MHNYTSNISIYDGSWRAYAYFAHFYKEIWLFKENKLCWSVLDCRQEFKRQVVDLLQLEF